MGDRALPYILPTIRDPDLQMRKYLNFLSALYDRKRLASRVKAYPIDATIDLVTACQLKCPYCAVGNRTIHRHVNHIEDALFTKIADELFEAAFIGWFFSAGEPLLHRKAANLLTTIKEKEIFSVISTNLSVPLSDLKIDDILNSGLGMLSVSLDGATSGAYAQYRCGGQFDLVWTNLRRLIDRKQQLGVKKPLIEWRFLVFEHNQHELDLAMQMAREIGVDLFEAFPGYAPVDAPPGQVRRSKLPLRDTLCGPALEQGRQRAGTAMQRYLQGRIEPTLPACGTDIRKCDWLYFGTMIYPDGAIAPCCVATDEEDDFTNLNHHNSFLDAWNTNEFEGTRQCLREGFPTGTVCDRCALPASRHYQFLQRVKAIMRNAPDWVLYLLASSPDCFLLPTDYELMPLETEALAPGRLSLDFDVCRIARRVVETRWPGGANAELSARIVGILERRDG